MQIQPALAALTLSPAVLLAASGESSCGHYGCMHSKLEAAAWHARFADGEELVDFDPATGESLLNYAPDTPADFLHSRLDLSIADMNTPRMEGLATHTLTPVGKPLTTLNLDANLLQINAVTVNGSPAPFEHDGQDLAITFNPPIELGAEATLAVDYTAIDPPFGLTWTPESDQWPGRPAQIHTQGQPETNSYWFPCHDFPNDRMTTELVITVPDGFLASSNGKLVERKTILADDRTRATRFHWLQEPNHPNYLVTLIVGKFDVVDLGNDELSMPVYVPPGRGGDVLRTYGNTAPMVELYSRIFDEPYPWARYAQLVVWNFGAGGMENTAATTMYDTAIFSEDGAYDHDLDGLIAHELAHQWFGDLLTCRTWEHIWLNEGFATYSESLWFEERDGRVGYDTDTLRNFDNVIRRDTGTYPDAPGMVSKRYTHPWEVFRRGSNPYPKGSSILHMLRREIGDELFFKTLADYIDENRLGNVETDQFRKVAERVSGESLERFFRQWTERPGIPRVIIETDWNGSELTITAMQDQPIDRLNPAFDIEIPFTISDTSGRLSMPTLRFDSREASMTMSMDSPPAWMAVDPDLHILAEWTVNAPDDWHRTLAQAGPTLGARVQGVRGLRATESTEHVQTLVTLARDPNAPSFLREQAARAAVELSSAEAVPDLLAGAADDPAVRRVTLDEFNSWVVDGPDEDNANSDPAVKDVDESIVAAIAATARTDRSARTRQQALIALGRLNAPDALNVLMSATATDSQNDRVRQGALEGLGLLDDPQALDTVLRHARPGTINRTRPVAISAAVNLASHDHDAVFKALRDIVATDRERRSKNAAAQALVSLEDARGVAALQSASKSARDPLTSQRMADLATELQEIVGN